MLLGTWKKTEVDFNSVFKKLFVTNAFDVSEDLLVSDELLSLIVEKMLQYRRQLLNAEVPANFQTVVKKLIPPKGI